MRRTSYKVMNKKILTDDCVKGIIYKKKFAFHRRFKTQEV